MRSGLFAAVAVLAAAGPALAIGPTRVPPAFLGEWNYQLAACGKGTDDSRLFIRPNRLEFYESSGPILSVKAHSARDITIKAQLSGEGETWTVDTRFRLSADGKQLSDVTDPNGPPFVRKRCPKR